MFYHLSVFLRSNLPALLVCGQSWTKMSFLYGQLFTGYNGWLLNERGMTEPDAAAADERADAAMTMTSLMDIHFISFRRSFSDVINPISITLCHIKHAADRAIGSPCKPRRRTVRPGGPLLLRLRIVFSCSISGSGGCGLSSFRLHFIRRHLFT